jgi:hypothetical protein
MSPGPKDKETTMTMTHIDTTQSYPVEIVDAHEGSAGYHREWLGEAATLEEAIQMTREAGYMEIDVVAAEGPPPMPKDGHLVGAADEYQFIVPVSDPWD